MLQLAAELIQSVLQVWVPLFFESCLSGMFVGLKISCSCRIPKTFSLKVSEQPQ